MALFGDLPPLESDGQGGAAADKDAAPADNAGGKGARAWALSRPTPNLRRPRPAARAAGSAVRPPVPALNPKHPHSMPQDPAALMFRWEAAATAGEQPVEQQPAAAGTAGRADGAAAAVCSLADYLPPRVRAKGRPRGTAEFDPHAEYDPAAPNSYQAYRAWTRAQKLARSQQHGTPDDDGNGDDGDASSSDGDGDGAAGRGDPGEPSVCVVLSNMVDAIDEGLERETMDECSAFGAVVRCEAAEAGDADGPLPPYERVRVVVEFAELEAAVRAQETLDRRLFGGRRISAAFHRPP
ncbi:hypothetical protein LPJ61_000045 [Coemansia biformis]|uniref:RNA recognition motif domain-containing protein n=1 Tax=Coemansia biformis TaxID=1286918 RepID=A0A9W8CZD1_9FUNG|nr:hypothetical protein LPJ61_000045 [Coemansia biformis]